MDSISHPWVLIPIGVASRVCSRLHLAKLKRLTNVRGSRRVLKPFRSRSPIRKRNATERCRTHLPQCAEIFKHEIRLEALVKRATNASARLSTFAWPLPADWRFHRLNQP